jgi:hypothetical protein
MLVYGEESVDEPLLEQEAPHPRGAQPLVRAGVGLLALALLAIGVLFVRGWRPGSPDESAKPLAAHQTMPISAEIEATYGIRFTLVNVTAGGGMIQIHYQVLDSDKVEAVHGTDLAPVVVDSQGVRYADPGMVGHSHVGKTQSAGATDYILLADAKGGVRHGSVVTIKVGDLELRNVPVE